MGSTALTQVWVFSYLPIKDTVTDKSCSGLLTACSVAMLGVSLFIALLVGEAYSENKQECQSSGAESQYCNQSSAAQFTSQSGGWGGFNSSLVVASLPPDRLGSEFLTFCISNGAQFIYSLLYLMLIYNVTLICQERDWGNLETGRRRLRCTIVKGESFSQDYLLQLPKMVLFPLMGYSVLTHWMLGQALQTQEVIWLDENYAPKQSAEHSKYYVSNTTSLKLFQLLIPADWVCSIPCMARDRSNPHHDWSLLVGLHIQTRGLYAADVRLYQNLLRCDDEPR